MSPLFCFKELGLFFSKYKKSGFERFSLSNGIAFVRIPPKA
jgi:hypothetical protein